MKDYIKINQAIDKKNIQDLKENMQRLKVEGGYPKRFTYPTILQFELTGQCNLACKHCYNRSGDEDRETLMTPDKWCELARQIVKDGGIFQCIISGGEPLLLGDKLFDIMDILHDDGTSFVVITNAFLLTPEKVKRFVKYRYFWFQVSIDGHCADIHDSFRGVPGSWKRAVYGALEISHATNTRAVMLHRLVSQRKLTQIVTNHLCLDFNIVETLSVVHTHHGSNHLRNNDHITKVSFHWLRTLILRSLRLSNAQSLYQSLRLSLQTTTETTTSTSIHKLHQVLRGHVQKLVQIDSTISELLESSLLLLFSIHCNVVI